MVKMSKRVKEVFNKCGLDGVSDDGRPYLDYGRHQTWNGEPCDQCGTIKKPSETGGKYIAGDSEFGTLLYLCGHCIDKLEEEFCFDFD